MYIEVIFRIILQGPYMISISLKLFGFTHPRVTNNIDTALRKIRSEVTNTFGTMMFELLGKFTPPSTNRINGSLYVSYFLSILGKSIICSCDFSSFSYIFDFSLS